MRRWTGGVALSALVAFAACSKSEPAPSPTPGPSASAAVAAEAKAPAAATKGPVVYKGTVTLEPGDLYIPSKGDVPNAKEWENTKWRGDDAGTELGEATLSLTVDEATGRVTGTLGGAAGEATLVGMLLGDRVHATISRADAGDMGLEGTLEAARTEQGLEGSVRLSHATARIIRRGTFKAARP